MLGVVADFRANPRDTYIDRAVLAVITDTAQGGEDFFAGKNPSRHSPPAARADRTRHWSVRSPPRSARPRARRCRSATGRNCRRRTFSSAAPGPLIRQLQLQNIPSEIGHCINLQTFYINNNQLKNIPNEIGHCINLQEFSISRNQLQKIPSEIGHCIILQRFYIYDNQLQNIPSEIGLLH